MQPDYSVGMGMVIDSMVAREGSGRGHKKKNMQPAPGLAWTNYIKVITHLLRGYAKLEGRVPRLLHVLTESTVLWDCIFPTVPAIGKLASCSAWFGTRSDTGGLAVIKFLNIVHHLPIIRGVLRDGLVSHCLRG